MALLVLAYYVELRSVMRKKPWLRKCQARCRHCGIFFLTDRCNAGREDLGCPFGCGREHRRRESTRRSVAYYREAEGKVKKARPQRATISWEESFTCFGGSRFACGAGDPGTFVRFGRSDRRATGQTVGCPRDAGTDGETTPHGAHAAIGSGRGLVQ